MLAAAGSIAVTGMLGRRLDTMAPHRVGRLLAAVEAATAAGMIGFGLAGRWWVAVPPTCWCRCRATPPARS